ncbi:hypothetical protein [Aestuariibacter salexigens]|nr:hypothetical protein [Aestuariibacter salexigens]
MKFTDPGKKRALYIMSDNFIQENALRVALSIYIHICHDTLP